MATFGSAFDKVDHPALLVRFLSEALSQISCIAVPWRHLLTRHGPLFGAASKVRAYYYKGTVEAAESIS